MIAETVRDHVNAYLAEDQILDAARFLMRTYGLEDPNLAGLAFREEVSNESILLTAEGTMGGFQTVRIPKNLFQFDWVLVLNLLAHEMLHVHQKSMGVLVMDKNEREWQAYCEMLFHTHFPQIPAVPPVYQKQFAEKALEYYRRMGKGSDLQQKYASQKQEVEQLLANLNNPTAEAHS